MARKKTIDSKGEKPKDTKREKVEGESERKRESGSEGGSGSEGEEVPKVPKNALYATGARKEAVARVWLWEDGRDGKNRIFVNRKDYTKYFGGTYLELVVSQPLNFSEKKYSIFATVSGGGISAQAQAVRLGISKILSKAEPGIKKNLKDLGFITRDAREVERKKYGHRKARKTQQWKKR